MIDTEAKLRAGLAAFVLETDAIVSPPPVASIAMRARTVVPRSRRWQKVAAVGVGTVVLSAGVASAVGVLPAPVESKLREFRSWGFGAEDGATRLASARNGEMRYELWRAPLRSGGECVYERVIAPGGDVDHGGSSLCGPHLGISVRGDAVISYPERAGALECPRWPKGSTCYATAAGRLPPGANRVIFEIEDGSSFIVRSEEDGYFITAFGGVREGLRIVGARAVGADGSVIEPEKTARPTR